MRLRLCLVELDSVFRMAKGDSQWLMYMKIYIRKR